MKIQAEKTFLSFFENGFWNQKILPDLCSFFVTAKHYLGPSSQ